MSHKFLVAMVREGLKHFAANINDLSDEILERVEDEIEMAQDAYSGRRRDRDLNPEGLIRGLRTLVEEYENVIMGSDLARDAARRDGVIWALFGALYLEIDGKEATPEEYARVKADRVALREAKALVQKLQKNCHHAWGGPNGRKNCYVCGAQLTSDGQFVPSW